MQPAQEKYKYEYNGKEFQEEFSLNWNDYGARNYDASLGRWVNLDALAEHPTQIHLTPYSYVGNNPVTKNDPNGNCPTCVFGAILGAAVDYGLQVATNYAEGKSGVDAWTDNINVTTIVTSAAVGFVTSGESTVSNLVKGSVKVGATVINNTVKYDTTKGLKVETNIVNIEKNVAIDLVANVTTIKIGNKVKKTISKLGQTKTGRLNKTAKNIVKSFKKNVTRARTENIKSGLKKTGKYSKISVETTVKYFMKKPKRTLKNKTRLD